MQGFVLSRTFTRDSSTLSLSRLLKFFLSGIPLLILETGVQLFLHETESDPLPLTSSTQPISYEGQNKNPEMCRVLLTHEVMCR